MDKNGIIPGGYYLKARCVQASDIATAPPHVREIWDWFIMKASHKDRGKVKRGQILTSYRNIQEGLCWYVGYRKCQYSKAQCETATKYLTKHQMITTTKTTRGMIVTVLNYDKYQDPKNYENRTETYNEPTREPQWHDTIYKNVKEERNIKQQLPAKRNDVFGFILDDGTTYQPQQDLLEQLAQAYPSLDIENELKKISAWCLANKSKRKTRRGAARFLNSWLSRAAENMKPSDDSFQPTIRGAENVDDLFN